MMLPVCVSPDVMYIVHMLRKMAAKIDTIKLQSLQRIPQCVGRDTKSPDSNTDQLK